MNYQDKSLLLLTATVNPMMDVARSNPQVRLNDYLNTLKIWWNEFESLPVDILFCENSGHDIQIIKDWISSINAEIRMPIFKYIGVNQLNSSFLKNFQATLFTDIGTDICVCLATTGFDLPEYCPGSIGSCLFTSL